MNDELITTEQGNELIESKTDTPAEEIVEAHAQGESIIAVDDDANQQEEPEIIEDINVSYDSDSTPYHKKYYLLYFENQLNICKEFYMHQNLYIKEL